MQKKGAAHTCDAYQYRSEFSRGLINGHRDRRRRNPVGHDNQACGTGCDRRRNIKLCTENSASGSDHAGPVVASAIHDGASGISDPNDGEIRRALIIVAVVGTLIQSIQLRALDYVVERSVGQSRTYARNCRRAASARTACGRVDFHIRREIGEEDLPSWQQHHIPRERWIVSSVRWRWHGMQGAAVPLEERARWSVYKTSFEQRVSVG